MHRIHSLIFSLVFICICSTVGAQPSTLHTDKEYHPNRQLKKKWEYYIDEWSEKRILHGRFSEWDREGKLVYEAKYDEGKLDGITIHYHDNGEIERIDTYKAGVREGAFYESREDGSLITEGNYFKGKLEGSVLYYNKKGKVTKKLVYHRGKKLTGKRLEEYEAVEAEEAKEVSMKEGK